MTARRAGCEGDGLLEEVSLPEGDLYRTKTSREVPKDFCGEIYRWGRAPPRGSSGGRPVKIKGTDSQSFEGFACFW